MTTGFSDDLVPATKLDVDKGRHNALPTIVVEAKDELLHKQFGCRSERRRKRIG